MVGELVTNAVAHTASGEPGGFVTVEVSSFDAVTAYIEVIDDGSAATVPEVRNADADECGGRGLWLVEAVAVSWGVRDEGYRRRVVWAECATRRSDIFPVTAGRDLKGDLWGLTGLPESKGEGDNSMPRKPVDTAKVSKVQAH